MDPVLIEPIFERWAASGNRLKRFWASAEERAQSVRADTVWLLTDTEQRQSIVKNGDFAGFPLSTLMQKHGQELVGPSFDKREGFPLTLRLVDTVQDTPLQVHPVTPGLPGANSKLWYLLDADTEQGKIGAGIRQRATRTQVMNHLNNKSLRDFIQSFPAKSGDSFLIPPGVVHYMGANMLMLELQHGNRVPHIVSYWGEKQLKDEDQQKALEAVEFENRHCWRIAGDSAHFAYTRKIPLVKQCPEFIVDEFRLKDYSAERTNELSFHLLCGIEGRFELKGATDYHVELGPGDVVCVPAVYGDYDVYARKGEAKFLRVRLMTESEPGVKERTSQNRISHKK